MDCSICFDETLGENNIDIISLLQEEQGYKIYSGRVSNLDIEIVHTTIDAAPFLKSPMATMWWQCEDKSHIIIYDPNKKQSSSDNLSICPYNTKNRVDCSAFADSEIKELSPEEISKIDVKDVITKSNFGKLYKAHYNDTELLLKYFQRKSLDYKSFNEELCLQHSASLKNLSPKIYAYWHCRDDWSIMLIENIDGNTVTQTLKERKMQNPIAIYLFALITILRVNWECHIVMRNISFENMIFTGYDVKILAFKNAYYSPEYNLKNIFKKENIEKPNLNELLLSDQDYGLFLDVSRLGKEFIFEIRKSKIPEYQVFADKIRHNKLDELNTIYQIYKELYYQKTIRPNTIYQKIFNIVSS